MVSEIILAQVDNLKKTDEGWKQNLEVAGGGMDRVQFVRNTQYIAKLSETVQTQDREIMKLEAKLSK